MAAYGDDAGFLVWLAGQGLQLPASAPEPAILRQIGSSYVDSAYSWKLTCSNRAGGFEQELEWPRTGHIVNGKAVPQDLIPLQWVHASYRAAFLQATAPGWATRGIDGSRQTRREKVDVIEREFFAPSETVGTSAAQGMPSDSIINGMVLPWLCSGKRSARSLFLVV